MYNPNDPANENPDAWGGGGSGDYVPPQAGQYTQTPPNDPYADYNGGSPPNAPLKGGFGWEWTGTRWIQVAGRGLGFTPNQGPDNRQTSTGGGSGGGNNQPAQPQSPTSTAGSVAGVPMSYAQSSLGGPVPTLDSAIAESKKLGQAPQVNPYPVFTPPTPVGLEGRNNIINAIMARPEVMDQTFQDQLFEQQKEQQNLMAQQARERIGQAGAARGLSAGGGFTAAALGGVEGNFINQLMGARRDIATQAAQVNRQSQIAAAQMQEAIAQGDYARAQSAYQTQLQAQNLYDELRFKAAEFDRANVALSAQTQMAGRQQQMAEQVASFQQYLEKLKFDEMMRQFNEQMGLNWGQFGWGQQMDLANLFPR